MYPYLEWSIYDPGHAWIVYFIYPDNMVPIYYIYYTRVLVYKEYHPIIYS
jgi:hypothetical protein